MEHKLAAIRSKFEPLFAPHSVAFIGASKDPRKWGHIVLANLINGGFPGKIYPVNPREDEILGLRAYRSVLDIPEIPDLAVFLVPPSSILPVVKDCVRKGVRAGLFITAGFAEIGKEGERLEQEMVEVARSGGMILVGPNCLGIMNPSTKLYPGLSSIFPPPGPIAIVAQSGNIAGSVVRQAMVNGFGCSKFISSGNEADLHCEDYLEYLAEDPETKVILGYIEGFKDGISFFRTAKEVSKKKPIVIFKAGGTPAGAMAAKSHTAQLTGSDAVFEAMCKQAGVIRARDLDDLLNIGVAFLRQPLPQGWRVGIVTLGGGWGVVTADACATLGLEVVSSPQETLTELDSFLSTRWSRGNPIDFAAYTSGDIPFRTVEVLLRCPVVDGAILLGIQDTIQEVMGVSQGADLFAERFSPSASGEEKQRWEKTLLSVTVSILDRLNELAKRYQKPVIVASELPFLDASLERKVAHALGRRGHVCYSKPFQTASVFASLARRGEYLRSVS